MTDRTLQSQADVVVLGSGAAGLIAAVEAAERGAKVLVLEREADIGGSTALAGGYVGLCETELEPGSREELFHDLVEAHHFDADEALSRLYVDSAPAMFVRLAELAVRFTNAIQFAHMSRRWGHELPLGSVGGGAQIVEKLATAARQRGVVISTNTRAERLLRDASGAVVGVRTGQSGEPIEAGTAVVIATGGFTRNEALTKHFGRPGTDKIYPITGSGSRGDGLVMGMAIGAATAYLGPGVAPTGPVDPATATGCLVNYAGGILLNQQGLRFTDESEGYLDISWAGLQQAERTMVQVFDQAIVDAYMKTMIGQVLSGWEASSGDTLAEALQVVSAHCGLDVERALVTVAEYNDIARKGETAAFGRRHLIGTDGALVPIETAPFYALATVPGTTHFNGGLSIDTEMRVVDVFGEIVPGLYAAGEVTGGFHGMGYLSGTHLGAALIFGQRAGINAASGAGPQAPTP